MMKKTAVLNFLIFLLILAPFNTVSASETSNFDAEYAEEIDFLSIKKLNPNEFSFEPGENISLIIHNYGLCDDITDHYFDEKNFHDINTPIGINFSDANWKERYSSCIINFSINKNAYPGINNIKIGKEKASFFIENTELKENISENKNRIKSVSERLNRTKETVHKKIDTLDTKVKKTDKTTQMNKTVQRLEERIVSLEEQNQKLKKNISRLKENNSKNDKKNKILFSDIFGDILGFLG